MLWTIVKITVIVIAAYTVLMILDEESGHN